MQSFFRNSILLVMLLFLFITCKKKVTDDMVESETFIHAYPAEGNQTCWYIRPTDDGGFLLIGTEDLHATNDGLALCIHKMDKAGKLQWKNVIKTHEMAGPIFTNLPDGSILVNSGWGEENLCKLDKNGQVVFLTTYATMGNVNPSYAIKLNDGSYAIACSNGGGSFTTTNWIAFLDSTGKYTTNETITDAELGFKTLYLSIHKCYSKGNYLLNGWCFPNWNGSFREFRQIFLAQRFAGPASVKNKSIVIDTANNNVDNCGIWQIYTKDNFLLLAASQTDINSVTKGRVLKIDDSLNVVWAKDLHIGSDNTYINDISECPDGNYLLCGVCAVSGKTAGQPFACKMDKNGNLLWSKIYSTSLSGYLEWAEQRSDGSCIFGGATNGFGQGSTLSDLYIIKTDATGNVK
jgi:hypothetical protein